MASSIIDSLAGLISPQLVNSLASHLGESTEAVETGLQGGTAAMLGGIANHAGDSGFLERIFGLIKGSATDSIVSSGLSSVLGGRQETGVGDLGSRFISQIFGSQQPTITDAISRGTGLKTGSANSIMAMAAPIVLSLLGQRIREQNLTPSSLGSLLKAEAPSLQRFLPAGLGGLITGASGMLRSASSPAVETASSGSRWLWPILGLLLIGGLIWYFNRGSDLANKGTELATNAGTATKDAASSALGALGDFFKRRLPNGTELNIPRLGIENKLVDFIEDSSKPVDKTTWFDFDRLLFDTGKATLQASSKEQLDNVANILKAYPKVKIKIGGYTDNTGDKASNMALSSARATTVMTSLVDAGIDKSRLAAEGYGDANPIADNTTEDGRARNRRISLRVTEK